MPPRPAAKAHGARAAPGPARLRSHPAEGYARCSAGSGLLAAQKHHWRAPGVRLPDLVGGAPALLKGFVDRVFLPGYAFKYRREGFPRQLLCRTAQLLVTWIRRPGISAGSTACRSHQLRKTTLEFAASSRQVPASVHFERHRAPARALAGTGEGAGPAPVSCLPCSHLAYGFDKLVIKPSYSKATMMILPVCQSPCSRDNKGPTVI